MQDCFISYGRKESLNFVHKLSESLIEMGLSVWFDKNDIPTAVDFQEEINTGILHSHNFICVISPHAIQSTYVKKEIELAVRLKKRIIPILHVEPDTEQQEKYLHPKIAKLNWLHFRDQEDDFQTSLELLHTTINNDLDFLRLHTSTQVNAEIWKESRRQDKYLLLGKNRFDAQAWIETQHENAPAELTNLQCEYIAQSRLLAERSASDVYIIGAEEDIYWHKKLKFALLRLGKTVTDRYDKLPNTKYNTQTEFRISSAKHILYLISADSKHNSVNEAEIRIAHENNKAIVRIRLDEVNLSQLTSSIADISLAGIESNVAFRKQFSEIASLLVQDDDYFSKHQKLLIRAKDWHLQKENPALLLRGNLLQQAQVWFNYADTRKINTPTQLQQKLIEESASKQAELDYDVFLAFSEYDFDYARYLNEELLLHAKTTWFEHTFISKSEFRDEVFRGIEQSENFVCILTNSALNNPELRAQIGHAQKFKKRIIALNFEEIQNKDLANSYSPITPIFFTGSRESYHYNFSELIRLLDIDHQHVQEHTTWLTRALNWENNDKNPDLLLVGHESKKAYEWLEKANTQDLHPAPTEKHTEFITQSQTKHLRTQKRRKQFSLLQKTLLVSISIALLLVVFFAHTTQQALSQAQLQRKKASALYKKASASNLVALARQLEPKNPTIAMRLGEKASELSKNEGVSKTLYDIYKNNTFYQSIGKHNGKINSIQYYNKNKQIITSSDDNTAIVWHLGQNANVSLEGHNAAVNAADISNKGILYLTASDDKTLRLWDTKGELVQVLNGHEAGINYTEFSHSGKQIVSAGKDKVIIVWSVTGDMLKILTGHNASISKAKYSPSDKFIVSCSEDRQLIIWNLQTESFQIIPQASPINDIAFSPVAKRFAIALTNGEVLQYSYYGELLQRTNAHHEPALAVRYSQSGELLLSTSSDKSIKIWSTSGSNITTLLGHETAVTDAVFANSDSLILSVATDNRIQAWNIAKRKKQLWFKTETPILHFLNVPNNNQNTHWVSSKGKGSYSLKNKRISQSTLKYTNRIPKIYTQLNSIDFAEQTWPKQEVSAICSKGEQTVWGFNSGSVLLNKKDSITFVAHQSKITVLSIDTLHRRILTGAIGRNIKLWTNTQLDTIITGHKGQITALEFSPRGNYFASGAEDGTIRLYTKNAHLTRVFAGHSGTISQIIFSANGKLIASRATDNTVRFWETNGYESSSVQFHSAITAIQFIEKNHWLAVALSNGEVHKIPVPELLPTFQKRNQYEPLSIAQMLELKIKFYEELKTEEELEQGAYFYFQKADLQTDRTKQIRYLVLADSLYQRLYPISQKPIYYAKHLQVLASMLRFETETKTHTSYMERIQNEMLKNNNEKLTLLAAKYLFEKAQKEKWGTVAVWNYSTAEKLYRKLHLEYSKTEYLVGRFATELMLAKNEKKAINTTIDQFENILKKTKLSDTRRASAQLFLRSELVESTWEKLAYLQMAERLQSYILQKQKTGNAYVALLETLLHLQEYKNSTDLTNKLKNISVQLFSVKNQKLIKDAADRFLRKAERESNSVRKMNYYRNSEVLYQKLTGKNTKAKTLINIRQALLGQKRITQQTATINTAIQNNLKQFHALDKSSELIVAISYFEREIALSSVRRTKIELLQLTLHILQKLYTKESSSDVLGKMHRVALELQQLSPSAIGINTQLQQIKQNVQKIDGEEQILEALAMYSQWSNETNNTMQKNACAAQQALLFSNLLQTKALARYAIRAWSFAQQWEKINTNAAQAFRNKLWILVEVFSEKEAAIWVEHINKTELNSLPVSKKLGKYLLQAKWTNKELRMYAYNTGLNLIHQLIVENNFSEAKEWAEKTHAMQPNRLEALSYAVLIALQTNGKENAEELIRNYKSKTYNAKSFAAYFSNIVKQLKTEGYYPKGMEDLEKVM